VATCRNPAVSANLLYGSILPNVIISNFDAMKNEFRGFRQIFEIYQAIPNASLEKMNGLIRVAVNICTWVYIFVGTFGYIAFFQKPFTGNILLSFKPSITSDVIKLGFVLSLAFSFPLVIFPCRASLNSLLYKGVPLRDNSITFFFTLYFQPSYTVLHEGAPANYIPEGKFKMLTLVIVSVSLIIALMIPTIELVLGLVGSTIGVMICVLFPVTCFICISPKNTNERILAQVGRTKHNELCFN
jgi:sodium-coupled neutral amino acid transporter 10